MILYSKLGSRCWESPSLSKRDAVPALGIVSSGEVGQGTDEQIQQQLHMVAGGRKFIPLSRPSLRLGPGSPSLFLLSLQTV